MEVHFVIKACNAEVCRDVAKQLVEQFVQSHTTIAIDSGGLCTAIIQEVGDRLKEGTLKKVNVVPSCDAAASEAAFVGVPQAISADMEEVRISPGTLSL